MKSLKATCGASTEALIIATIVAGHGYRRQDRGYNDWVFIADPQSGAENDRNAAGRQRGLQEQSTKEFCKIRESFLRA